MPVPCGEPPAAGRLAAETACNPLSIQIFCACMIGDGQATPRLPTEATRLMPGCTAGSKRATRRP
jgi:hypothetical protein